MRKHSIFGIGKQIIGSWNVDGRYIDKYLNDPQIPFDTERLPNVSENVHISTTTQHWRIKMHTQSLDYVARMGK